MRSVPSAKTRVPAAAAGKDEDVSVNVRFPQAMVDEVDRLAATDVRSRSRMCMVLIREALKARGIDVEALAVGS